MVPSFPWSPRSYVSLPWCAPFPSLPSPASLPLNSLICSISFIPLPPTSFILLLAFYEGSRFPTPWSTLLICFFRFVSLLPPGLKVCGKWYEGLLLFYLYCGVCDLCRGVTGLENVRLLSAPFRIRKSALATLERSPGLCSVFQKS